MLELSAAGAKVLQSRSVESLGGAASGSTCGPRSTTRPGTWVQEVDERQMEDVLISGVALETDEAKVTFDGVPDNRASPRRCSRRSPARA